MPSDLPITESSTKSGGANASATDTAFILNSAQYFKSEFLMQSPNAAPTANPP